MGNIEAKCLDAKACRLAIGHRSKRRCLIMNVSEPEMTSVTDLTDDELAQKWNETEWAEVETIVNNLQVRIASAAKKQRNLF